MRATALGVTVVLAAAIVASAVPAGGLLRVAEAQEHSCAAPQRADGHPLAGREEALSRYEALPASCLKTIFLACTHAANAQLLDLGNATACSIGYEALLRRAFAGDFHALMAWWRVQRHDPLLVH
jgi:hypothetical protein